MRGELLIPAFAPAATYDGWVAEGAPDAAALARERVEGMLADWEQP